jgi:F-type H+-transporting ATPase subunit epsilon
MATEQHKTFTLRISTPAREFFSAEIRQITIMTEDGEITVLAEHTPLVSSLKPGVARILNAKGEEVLLAHSGGFLEMDGQIMNILADSAERAEELDEAKVEEARKQAEKAMSEKRTDKVGFTEAAAILERELARLKLIKRVKSHRSGNRE